ncbi:hypothetical protein [Segniliparus rugosus]|uniref:PknH-like extracellular domain-containing protein n=1 Tax=Segniliparus rugosus (strain ATCC BAA-974 / DSM 45345 / CCUG 50838 / CIP 108380 / JCM 13579 / CDC 945) TaxID=679197 RepID=U1N516_SEGRC|nr:hypothetical protein [Segniliparus rugosus]ERG69269.1 hypothetical protein HMPREF9336_04160 [Segniliparus rugosus ATCC BAA-974]
MPARRPLRCAPSLVAAIIMAVSSCAHPGKDGENGEPSTPKVAPIPADAIQQLFEPGHFDASGNLENMYSSASPPECRGLVLEVDSPLLMRDHVATASVIAPKPGDPEHAQIVEIAAIYRDDFSPTDLIAEAAKTRERCQGTPITGSTQGGATAPSNWSGSRTRGRRTSCSGPSPRSASPGSATTR